MRMYHTYLWWFWSIRRNNVFYPKVFDTVKKWFPMWCDAPHWDYSMFKGQIEDGLMAEVDFLHINVSSLFK